MVAALLNAVADGEIYKVITERDGSGRAIIVVYKDGEFVCNL